MDEIEVTEAPEPETTEAPEEVPEAPKKRQGASRLPPSPDPRIERKRQLDRERYARLRQKRERAAARKAMAGAIPPAAEGEGDAEPLPPLGAEDGPERASEPLPKTARSTRREAPFSVESVALARAAGALLKASNAMNAAAGWYGIPDEIIDGAFCPAVARLLDKYAGEALQFSDEAVAIGVAAPVLGQHVARLILGMTKKAPPVAPKAPEAPPAPPVSVAPPNGARTQEAPRPGPPSDAGSLGYA